MDYQQGAFHPVEVEQLRRQQHRADISALGADWNFLVADAAAPLQGLHHGQAIFRPQPDVEFHAGKAHHFLEAIAKNVEETVVEVQNATVIQLHQTNAAGAGVKDFGKLGFGKAEGAGAFTDAFLEGVPIALKGRHGRPQLPHHQPHLAGRFI